MHKIVSKSQVHIFLISSYTLHRNTAQKLFMKNWALIDEDAVASKKRWISEYPFSSNDSSWCLMQTNHFSVIMHLCKSSLGKNHGNYFFKGSAAVTERTCLHEDTRLLNFRLITAKVSSYVTLSRRTENRTWLLRERINHANGLLSVLCDF